ARVDSGHASTVLPRRPRCHYKGSGPSFLFQKIMKHVERQVRLRQGNSLQIANSEQALTVLRDVSITALRPPCRACAVASQARAAQGIFEGDTTPKRH